MDSKHVGLVVASLIAFAGFAGGALAQAPPDGGMMGQQGMMGEKGMMGNWTFDYSLDLQADEEDPMTGTFTGQLVGECPRHMGDGMGEMVIDMVGTYESSTAEGDNVTGAQNVTTAGTLTIVSMSCDGMTMSMGGAEGAGEPPEESVEAVPEEAPPEAVEQPAAPAPGAVS